MTDPQAWVGCLTCYNNGDLVGEWVEGIEAGDYTPCERPGHEEWWVFDHQDYGPFLKGECSPAEATGYAETISDIPDDERQAFFAWADNIGPDNADYETFHDAYEGVYDDEEDFAHHIVDQTCRLPEDSLLARYFDYEAYARDLFIDEYTSAPAESRGIHVWRDT